MKFEEQFPSLKEKDTSLYANWLNQGGVEIRLSNFDTGERDLLFKGSIIQRHCLDKERVKEVLVKEVLEMYLHPMSAETILRVKRKLGLDD